MSLSQPRKSNNPAAKFIEWGGKEGVFFHYDKENEEKVFLETPLYIIKLDQLSTVTGYNKDKGGIYSNEVKNIMDDTLKVKYYSGDTIAEGIWNDIKPHVIMAKGKYAQSVYAALIDPKTSELELVNFKFHGSSIGPWIDAKVDDSGCVIILDKNPSRMTNGDTSFYIPTVTKSKVREDIIEKAIDMDKDLQSYLSGSNAESEDQIEKEVAVVVDNTDDLPF